jgi:GT2 family glycosyltransferase
MKLSFLIINYNGGEYLTACLKSISRHASSVDHEVIVVDNNSSDGSANEISDLFKDVKLIRNSRNLGFSRGMNQAYRVSKGEYVFSFNPDAELTEGCIDLLVRYMDTNPRVGKIGTATVEDGKILMPATEFPRWNTFQTLKALRSKLPARQFPSERVVSEVRWLFGTGILVRRSALSSDTMMYSETSFLFWEEYWLSEQVRRTGFQITVLPEAKIIHHSGVTFKKNREKLMMARVLSSSHEFLIRKFHYGILNARLNAFFLFVDHLLLYLLFLPKRIILRNNVDLYNTVNDYYAKARGALMILLRPGAQIESLDKRAEEFFNR